MNHMNSIVYKGPDFDKKIYIGLYKKHFCSILSMPGFFSSSYYCHECDKPYSNLKHHFCKETCRNCLTRPPCKDDSSLNKT